MPAKEEPAAGGENFTTLIATAFSFPTKDKSLFRNHQRIIVNAKEEHDRSDPLTRGNIGAPVANLFSESSFRTHPGSRHRACEARNDANLYRKL